MILNFKKFAASQMEDLHKYQKKMLNFIDDKY
jgi:hypothetical protein